MTDARGAAPGWYADPLGRHQLRWFNGRGWTSDVADGGVRGVDLLGVSASPVAGRAAGRQRAATASMVLGIVALSIAWMPVVVVAGLIVGCLAIVLGIVGLRGTARGGRSFAIAGIATGTSALFAGIIGIILTLAVLDAYDAYLDPQPHEIALTDCELQGTRAVVSGALRNTGSETGDFSVLIGFARPGTDNVRRTDRVTIDDVEPGGTATFEAQAQVDLDDVECLVVDVTGPLPFGIALD